MSWSNSASQTFSSLRVRRLYPNADLAKWFDLALPTYSFFYIIHGHGHRHLSLRPRCSCQLDLGFLWGIIAGRVLIG